MTGVAVMFDILPLILVLLMTVFVYHLVASSADFVPFQDFDAVAKEVRQGTPWYLKGWTYAGSFYVTQSLQRDWTRGGIKAGAGVAAGASIPILGPVVYIVGSLVATTMSFVVFLLWFGAKRVFVLALTPRRVGANMAALIIKAIPLLNILPGITLAVVMHIRQTRAEDRERHKKKYGNNALM